MSYSIDFSQFDNIPVEMPQNNSFEDYEEIPDNEYVCSLDSIEFSINKKGNPMQTIKFTIKEGEFLRRKIFIYNVLLDLAKANDPKVNGLKIHMAKEKLKSLCLISKEKEDEAIVFENMEQFSNIIEKLNTRYQAMIARGDNILYTIDKSTNAKGFSSYKITRI